MEHLPIYIYLVFGLTVFLALFIFYLATQNSKPFLAISSLWIIAQVLVSLTGFYTLTKTVPPRFPLLVVPPIVLIVLIFTNKRGKQFISSLDHKKLTILHIIRIPVELVLFWLVAYKAVPELMTFEGRNFDIFSGITAPFIYYFGFVKKKLSKWIIISWNFICIGLLLNVVFNAVLSVPTGFQQFAFEQPNIAIGYFPFVLLPAFIVPIVMFSHLATISLELKSK